MAGIDSNTVLMLHCDGTNGSTTFTDSSQYTHTVTANGNAQVSTSNVKFGTGSGVFDGTGDYLALDGSSDFAFGSGDYTVDFWVRVASLPQYAHLYDARPTSTLGAYLVIYVDVATGHLQCTNGTTDIGGTTNLNSATYAHIAVTRSGTTRRVFVNGTIEATDSSDSVTLLNPTGRPWFGGKSYGGDGGVQSLLGNFEEIRVSKGIARWTSNFTPPAAAYTLDAPTNSVAPVASGTPTVGQTLSVTNGTWTNSPSSYTYQWQRDNTGGGVYSNIAAATASTYLLVSGDTSCNVRCVVTATNAGGSTAANSNALGPVAAGAGPPAYPYINLVPSFDLDNVFNRWTVTRDQGSPQTAEDTTSQQKYFLRAKQTQTLVSDDTAALAQAARKIAKYKDPLNRVESMTIMPLQSLTNTAQIDAGLGRQLGDRITIQETPPGFAGVQSKEYVIQNISGQIHAGPMLSMTLTFGVWPA
jgi:hypothetical protein